MRRVLGILTLAAVAGLVAAREAGAAPVMAGMGVHVAQHATGHPGHHGYGHGHHGYAPRPYSPHFRGPVHIPVSRPPVIVHPLVRPYPCYYGYPGTVSIYGRGWGLSLGF